MTEQHPITPPPELVQQWYQEADNQLGPYYDYIATQAARWGADQELEACCELMDEWELDQTDLRFARRPKPPSLKEQALALLDAVEVSDDSCSSWDFSSIRRALEALDD